MKKVLLLAVVGGFLSLTSCKKDYTCTTSFTFNGETTTTETPYNGLKKSEASAQKTVCTLAGGTWATK